MQKNILITGASTGIGNDAARALIENGFHVIATVRKAEDEKQLKSLYGGKISVLLLDVTHFSEVERLPAMLKEIGITELFGLINNAGIALAAPFVYQPFSEIESTLQVNVISLMKVTQVLLPLLGTGHQGSRGRVINISSVAGKSGAPFLAAYVASKHAVEGFSESLRKELMLFGISVIVVGPGSIKTPIWKKGFEVIKEKYDATPYRESFGRFMKIAKKESDSGLEPQEVSRAIVEALTAVNPKFRYAPIPRKLVNWYLPMVLPARVYNNLTAKALKIKKA